MIPNDILPNDSFVQLMNDGDKNADVRLNMAVTAEMYNGIHLGMVQREAKQIYVRANQGCSI